MASARIFTAGAIALVSITVFNQRQRLKALSSMLGPKWNNLHPDVQQRAVTVLDAANDEFSPDGLAVGIFDGWRSTAAQQKEIDEGDSFVSSAMRSFHPWGMAVDFVFITPSGQWTWLPDPADADNSGYWDPRWNRLGRLIESAGFSWGGRWNQRDGPHAELPVIRPSALMANFNSFPEYQRTWAA